MSFWKNLFGGGSTPDKPIARHALIEKSTFPLILLVGNDPNPEKFFSPGILDAIGPVAGIYRKDILASDWNIETSFKAIKRDVSRTWGNDSAEQSIATVLIPLANDVWGKRCFENSVQSIHRVIPLQCYLLVLSRPLKKTVGKSTNAGFVPYLFPKWGKFHFKHEEFINSQAGRKFREAISEVMQQYQSNFSPRYTDDVDFEVLFNFGTDLQSFMSQLNMILKECGTKEERIIGWSACSHGRYRYEYGSWPETVCAECLRELPPNPR